MADAPIEPQPADQPDPPAQAGRTGLGSYWPTEVLLAVVVFAAIVFAIPQATEVALSYERAIPQLGRHLYEMSLTMQYVYGGLAIVPWLVLMPFAKLRWLRIAYLLIAASGMVILLLNIAVAINPP